jgi:hypothetical protein
MTGPKTMRNVRQRPVLKKPEEKATRVERCRMMEETAITSIDASLMY